MDTARTPSPTSPDAPLLRAGSGAVRPPVLHVASEETLAGSGDVGSALGAPQVPFTRSRASLDMMSQSSHSASDYSWGSGAHLLPQPAGAQGQASPGYLTMTARTARGQTPNNSQPSGTRTHGNPPPYNPANPCADPPPPASLTQPATPPTPTPTTRIRSAILSSMSRSRPPRHPLSSAGSDVSGPSHPLHPLSRKGSSSSSIGLPPPQPPPAAAPGRRWAWNSWASQGNGTGDSYTSGSAGGPGSVSDGSSDIGHGNPKLFAQGVATPLAPAVRMGRWTFIPAMFSSVARAVSFTPAAVTPSGAPYTSTSPAQGGEMVIVRRGELRRARRVGWCLVALCMVLMVFAIWTGVEWSSAARSYEALASIPRLPTPLPPSPFSQPPLPPNTSTLLPTPSFFLSSTTTLRLTAPLRLSYLPSTSLVLQRAADRFQEQVFGSWTRDTTNSTTYTTDVVVQDLWVYCVGAGRLPPPAQGSTPSGAPYTPLQLSLLARAYDDTAVPLHAQSERYVVWVPSGGVVVAVCEDVVGCVRAVETVGGMISPASTTSLTPITPPLFPTTPVSVSSYVLQSAPWYVHDMPRLTYRAVQVDTWRRFVPVPVLQKVVEGWAAARGNVVVVGVAGGNVFAANLTGSLLSPLSLGSLSRSEIYTEDALLSLSQFASDRGVRTIPSLSIPGGVGGWRKGYTGVLECGNGVYQLDLLREDLWPLLGSLFKRLATVFADPLVRVVFNSVDVDAKCYDRQYRNATVDAVRVIYPSYNATTVTTPALLTVFSSRMISLLASLGKVPVVDATWLADGRGTGDGVVVEVNGADEQVRQVAHAGVKYVVGGARWGVECGMGGATDMSRPCSLPLSWRHLHLTDPSASLNPLYPSQTDPDPSNLYGAVADVPLEYTDPANLESTLFPRLAVLGERWWSPRGAGVDFGKGGDAEDKWGYKATGNRLRGWRARVVERGVGAGPVGGDL